MKLFAAVFVCAICTVTALSIIPERDGVEGKCPVVPFVENFDGAKFLGKWYAIRQTGPKGVPCIYHQVEEPKPNYFEGFMTPINVTLKLTRTNANDFSEGLSVEVKEVPFLDGGNLRLFATDYG